MNTVKDKEQPARKKLPAQELAPETGKLKRKERRGGGAKGVHRKSENAECAKVFHLVLVHPIEASEAAVSFCSYDETAKFLDGTAWNQV
jgi:hypothetical protein